jgi:serine/threonine protein kinase/WD40 repeat protein
MDAGDKAIPEMEIFEQALEVADAAERLVFLTGACGENAALLARVQALLQAHEAPEGFLPHKRAGQPTVVPLSEKPGDRIGRYKLREKIGEGGCGVVYVAEQEEPVRRKVALKVIKLGMDTKAVVARFEAERQALAMMDHPNIAKVLDAGATETGRPYFVMELVRGIKITDYCDEHQLATRERLELFIKVCQAVQHAHQKGIIHRDLKPSNILVTVNDGAAVPKVIDFGIAKATEGKLTEMTVYTDLHQFIGTPAYMSPEQATMTSLDIDTRSDIYSLGVLLYEILTGHTPFDTKELMALGMDALRRTIREKEPVRPSTRLSTMLEGELTTTAKHRASEPPRLIHQVRGDLDWIAMKCLEKDRKRRYDTANGLAMDLQRHLGNEPVIARPPSAAYKFQKAFHRNKLVWSAAIAILVALIVGLGSATVMFFREHEALKGEQQQRLQAQSTQKAADSERQHSRQLLYAADMNLAQQALNQNNLGRVRRLLDRHRPQPGEEDLRGWEWRYLWQLTRNTAIVTLTNRPVRGFSVSFSPDGRRLAVGWYDGCVELWDVPNRRFLRSLNDRQDVSTGHVAFSPVRNLLAATSRSNTVTMYDLDSGRESIIWREPDEHEWDLIDRKDSPDAFKRPANLFITKIAIGVHDLSFSQDGSKVVIYATSADLQNPRDAVWVVDVSSARIESCHPTDAANHELIGATRMSPDNQRLYLSRYDYWTSPNSYSIQCLDLGTDREIWRTERLVDDGLTALAVSPDGRVLASGSIPEDHSIRIWDADTGRLVKRIEGHTSWVSKLIFTKDGHRLISAAADQTIRFWDTETWTQAKVLRGHQDEVHALALSESAHLIASASKDGDLALWKDEEEKANDGYFQLPKEVHGVGVLDRSRVILFRNDKPQEVFDLGQDVSLGLLPWFGPTSNVWARGIGWLCHWDGTNQILVEKWNGSQFDRLGVVTTVHSGQPPNGVTFNLARQLVAWNETAEPYSVFLASLRTPEQRVELKSEMAGLWPARFSMDGNYLAATTPPPEWAALRVWNVDTRHIAATLDEPITDIAFGVGSRLLIAFVVISQRDHELRFYDLNHPDRAPRCVPGKHKPQYLQVSPDGRLVAAATEGGLVRLCDAVTGELIEDLQGNMNAANNVCFSPDGHRLISSGVEAVKLWDVGTRQELLTLAGTGGVLPGAKWSADGDTILAGAPWQAWHAPSWEEIAAAEAKEKEQSQRP